MLARSFLAVSLSLVACGDDGGGSDSSGGVADDAPATMASTNASTGMTAASADDGSGSVGMSGSDAADTSGPGDSSGPSATTTGNPPATGTADDAGSSSGSAGSESDGSDSVLELDPKTITAFDLPINSLRFAVTGQDNDSDTCVTIIWFISNFNEAFEQHCGLEPNSPYVVITPDATAPCGQWDYQGNVTVDSAVGCAQFMDTMPLTAEVDITLEVSGGPFTGTVIANNL